MRCHYVVFAFLGFCLVASSGCSETKKKGKVGAFCNDDSDCESGLCFESVCLDPDRDEDGDGLKNGIEVHILKTNPLDKDSDGDGVLDLEEVGDIRNPKDIDGDGLIDALESRLLDPDKDCLPDQFDPHNEVPDKDASQALLAEIHCLKAGGVCAEGKDKISVSCLEGVAVCSYGEVAGYEEEETTCDGKDNDCDGDTDEGLGGEPCEIENDFGACPGTTICDGSGGLKCEGKEPKAEVCNGLDDNCNGETDEGLDMLGECYIENEYGKCPGTLVCENGQEVCSGKAAAREVCNNIDDNCDGRTDEDDICLKTVQISGAVRDGMTNKPLEGAVIDVYEGEGPIPIFKGTGQGAVPVFSAKTEADGRYEIFLVPKTYRLVATMPGYRTVQTEPIKLEDKDILPLNVAMVPETSDLQLASMCGRVLESVTANDLVGVEDATIALLDSKLQNALAHTKSTTHGLFCITGVLAYDLDGKPLESFGISATKEGYYFAFNEYVPNLADTVTFVELYTYKLPPEEVKVFLNEDFEEGLPQGWTVDNPVGNVGWQWLKNGVYQNLGVDKCVQLPALDENCVKDAKDPECALCASEEDFGCIPKPGALPRAYSGKGALWFGNESLGNYLPSDSVCEALEGGSGGPVSGSLTTPWFKVGGPMSLFLGFYTAFEIEAVDRTGADHMFIEMRDAQKPEFRPVLDLNPAIKKIGKPYQPFSSGGFDRAPIWAYYMVELGYVPNPGEVQIRFRFDSNDKLYNGFRGWLIDKVQVFGF